MKNFSYKLFLPHVVAVLGFFILAYMFYQPLFNGYVVEQGDVKQHVGMSKEIVDYRVMHDDQEPLWTNSMFSGMPAYQVSVIHQDNWTYYLDNAMKLGLPRPVAILFWSMLGFYIFALCLRINPWLSMIGAVAFSFSTINILYIGAGHMSKVNAISYIAPALGGFILAFRGKAFLGGAIFALFFSLQVTANHLQMTYYLALILAAVAIGESLRILIKKEWKQLLLSYGVLSLATFFAILPAASNLVTTQEYGKYTTRGTSDLSIKPKGQQSSSIDENGLNKNYILEYNYGEREILSAAFPNVKGGSQQYLVSNKEAVKIITKEAKFNEYADYLLNDDPKKGPMFVTYFGGQAASGGAFYFGIIMIVFAILGFVFVKDSLRWPFLVILLLSGLLASNDPEGINAFFIENFPMYNKFRDSKMILVLAQLIFPAMALLFLNGLLSQKTHESEKSTDKVLTLKSEGKMIFGVCAGLAAYYGKDKNLFRGLILVSTVLLGWGVIIYLSLWLMIPKDKNSEIHSSVDLHGDKKWWFVGLMSIVFGVVVLYLFPSISGAFLSSQEAQMLKTTAETPSEQVDLINGLKNSLVDLRIELFRSDILRGLILVVMAGVLFILAAWRKISPIVFLAVFFVLVTYDNMSVAKRYFNNDPIEETSNTDQEMRQLEYFTSQGYIDGVKADKMLAKYEFEELTTIPKALPTTSDSSILNREKSSVKNFESLKSDFLSKMDNSHIYVGIKSDKTREMIASFAALNSHTNYRVLSFGNPFNETNTSYFHKSIGGYHGAKLKRYQELIEHHISSEIQLFEKEMQQLITDQKNSAIEKLQKTLAPTSNFQSIYDTLPIMLSEKYTVLNMLNTRYLAINPNSAAIKNNGANGNAWFVSSIKKVANANNEMLALGKINSKKEAVINTKDFPEIAGSLSNTYAVDSTASIRMLNYDVNKVSYESSSKISAPVIFSEIYYPEGWNCYIDGKKTNNIFRANYVLRAALIPAGKHKIEWKFEPESFYSSSSKSMIGSALLFTFVIGSFGFIAFGALKKARKD